jgi:tetratricopeptide (TPR) repeat protein
MERLDFASVMAVLRRNIPDENFTNQADFLYSLFVDMDCGTDDIIDFYSGQACRWFNGIARLSPSIIRFYQQESNKEKLRYRIQNEVLPLMPDSAMAAQELYDLVLLSTNVSPSKKMELTDGYAFEDDNDEAVFVTEILCLAMQLPFMKRDVREKQLLTSGVLSPVVVDYIFDTDMPRPCRWFLGREQELEQLHALLVDHSKVFLHGIPGIGKSELAKAYAKQYGKEYTNVIYVNYPGDLKQAVIDLDFADDMPDESDDARFKRHNRFLRSLREDTLLIVDNFNVTASQDQFLDVMLKYRCRILFTTRSRYENHISLEVGELNPDTLLELVGKFFPEAERKQDEIKEIIALLHGHTFAVELAARLLANGMMKPKALLTKLQKEKAALDADDKIGTTKDGRNRKATYYDHIHSLFSLYKLTDSEQEILRGMTLIPANGISSRRFAAWMDQQNMNTINDLMEMGFIHPKNSREILLHPMIREVAVEELKPSVRNASVLLDSLQEISLMHGLEFMNNKTVFHTVESIIATIRKDDTAKYLLFLENVFQYMDKYRYEAGMQAIIEEMTTILSDASVGTSADRACLLDARAVLEKNTRKQIGLVEEALRVLGDVHSSNAHLAANLHANLGALYHKAGRMDLAKLYMEKGVQLLEEYHLTGYHDSVTQICNYAALITDLGEPQRAYSALLKLARTVKELNSDQCLDFGLIQQVMGSVCVVKGDAAQAQLHHQRAMAIFEMVFEDEPTLLEQKRQEIGQAALVGRQKNQKLLV